MEKVVPAITLRYRRSPKHRVSFCVFTWLTCSANDAQAAASAAVCPETEGARAQAHLRCTSQGPSPTFQQPQAATTPPQQHPQLPRLIVPQSPTSPLATALIQHSHLPQHHNISFCPQNFDIHPHSSVPLRRLTHINFTCIRLHHPPIATVTTLHSLRASTTSSQQPIRLAGDTRPPPA